MEGSTFNPGFLGSHFNWWVGQIADDSTWRDNMLPGKYDDPQQIKGWGRRYKVRIIGLHPVGEETPSEDLPWAQVMYPVTAGGGQAEAAQTPNLRQGNMVFGFFLDDKDQQVPVIMGVLGNNSQTLLKTTIGTSEVTDDSPGSLATSGYATGKVAKTEQTAERVPDEGLQTSRPGVSAHSVPAVPGTPTDRYGIRSDIPYTPEVRGYISDATTEADRKNLQGDKRDKFITDSVQKNLRNQSRIENSPLTPSQPGATRENADGVHQTQIADIKRQEMMDKRTPQLKPDDKVTSAISAIQTTIDNLMNTIDKYLQSFQSYLEAASGAVTDSGSLRNIIKSVSQKIAKYMKIIFDKIIEYVQKIFNNAMTAVVSSTPANFRHLVGDMKEQTTALITCLYNKIVETLSQYIEDALLDAINIDELERQAKQALLDRNQYQTFPSAPICFAEDIVATVIAARRGDINDANNSLVENLGKFVTEMQTMLSGELPNLGDVMQMIPDIEGNISAAFGFNNLSLDIFGCQLSPNVAVSDFYTLADGSSGQPQVKQPSASAINKATQTRSGGTAAPAKTPFAQPAKNQATVRHDKPPQAKVKPT